MAERFIVNEEEKVIYAKMGMLTDKDKKAIKDYVDLFGYKIEKYVPIQKTEEEKKLEEEKQKNSKYTEEKIKAYLLKYGTEEEQKKFVDIQEEIAIDKQTNKPKVWEKDTKTHKKGEPKKKGYIGALSWFRKLDKFKTYPEAPKQEENKDK